MTKHSTASLFSHLSLAGGSPPHYSIVCFPRRPLWRLETDKAGSVLSNRPHREKARPGTPALTSAILETWIQVAIQEPPCSPAHCGRQLAWQSWCWWGSLRWGPCTPLLPVTKTKHRQKNANLNQSTDRDSMKAGLLTPNSTLGMRKYKLLLFFG